RDDDLDGLDNEQEAQLGTDPALRDTDGDGFSDYVEVQHGTDPNTFAGHRLKVTFCGYNEKSTLANFPALIKLDDGISGFDYETFLSPNGHDLRIWNSNQTATLNYEIDTWKTGGVSLIWVQVPALVSSNDCLWLTWGVPTWTSQPAYAINGAMWSENYIGVWHMNSTDPEDATGNGNDGSGTGVSLNGGVVGEGADFDGNGSIIDITHAYKLPVYTNGTGNRFTFEGWVKGPDQSGLRYFGMGNTNDNTMHYSYLSRAGTVGRGRVFIRDDQFQNLQISETGMTEFDNTWRHLVWVDDVGTLDHWVDGFQDSTDFDYTTNTITLNTTTFGALRRTLVSHGIDGIIDEFRISDGLRSSNWIYTTWQNVDQYGSFLCPGPVESA
ncbi:MAG: DUF2341 domain-containing protein, partial [Verrucomicrobiota bacterium]